MTGDQDVILGYCYVLAGTRAAGLAGPTPGWLAGTWKDGTRRDEAPHQRAAAGGRRS